MARIVPKEESGLVLTAEGRWKHRGETATHRGVADYFHRQIRRDERGEYFLYNSIDVPEKGITLEEHVYFDMEDTPFFIRRICALEPEAALEVELSTGETQRLDLASLSADPEGRLYARVKNGDPARFDRHATVQLEPYLRSDEDGMFLALGPARVRIRSGPRAR